MQVPEHVMLNHILKYKTHKYRKNSNNKLLNKQILQHFQTMLFVFKRN